MDALCSCYQFIPKDLLITEYIQFVQKYENIVRNVNNLPKKINLNENKSSDSSDDSSGSSSSETDKDEETILPLTIKYEIETMEVLIFCIRFYFTSNMNSVFSYLYLALRIALTLPTSSSSTERPFSCLKILITELRPSALQKRIENLLIISIENDIEVEKDVLLFKKSYSTFF